MDGISFGISEGAIAGLSVLIGAVGQRIISGGGAKKSSLITKEDCQLVHDKNDIQHKEFFERIERLELADARSGETLRNIDRRLTSIDNKLDGL